ncbi:MAG: ATP-binding protein, partial [Phormidesmis sp.]
VTVERKYNKALPELTVFGSELNQVWTNLIDNAIDAIEEGTPDGSSGKIIIRTCQKSESLLVEIEDNGPGIPAAVRNRILDPFFTTKPMGKGSGLGLDVVRRVVQNRHGGSLLVESVPGRTVFSVRLPIG